jgi:hypothetical protein
MRKSRAFAAAAAAAVLGAGAAVTAGPALAARSTAAAPAAAHWAVVKSVKNSADEGFSAVAATGGHSAWAFEATSSNPVAWLLDGSSSKRFTLPSLGAGTSVVAASASGPGNVWAVGNNRALRWNGASWQTKRSFGSQALSVTAVSPADVLVLTASSGTWRFNGSSWAKMPASRGLTQASALSGRDIWAVAGTSVAHWNGRKWARTSVRSLLPANSEFTHYSLADIYARSAGNVWAAASGNTEDEGGPLVLLHYTSGHWHKVNLHGVYLGPDALISDGSGGLWIPVGQGGDASGQMLHYTGGRIHVATLPVGKRTVFAGGSNAAGTKVVYLAGATLPGGLGNIRAVVLRYGS